MKVDIDKEGCIACGMCVNICPEVFRFGGDGKAEPYADAQGHEAEVAEAADSCPVSVISYE